MARRGTLGLWLAIVAVAAGIGLAAGVGADSPAARPAAAGSQGGVTVLTPTGVEAAVVPARTEAGPGVGARTHPGRSFVPLLVALLGLAGLLGLRSRWPSPAVVAGRHPRAARRHAIALRAPPSLLRA